jgi:hypothetical protein
MRCCIDRCKLVDRRSNVAPLERRIRGLAAVGEIGVVVIVAGVVAAVGGGCGPNVGDATGVVHRLVKRGRGTRRIRLVSETICADARRVESRRAS